MSLSASTFPFGVTNFNYAASRVIKILVFAIEGEIHYKPCIRLENRKYR